MSKEEIMANKPSAQSIYQKCVVIRNCQYMLRSGKSNQENQEMLASLVKEMKEAIQLWGGIEEIDGWLLDKDRFHSLLCGIKGMDWSWL